MKGKPQLIATGILLFLLTGTTAYADSPTPASQEQWELTLRSSQDASYTSTIRIASPKWRKWAGKFKQVNNPADPAPAYSVMELAVPDTAGAPGVYRVSLDQNGAALLQREQDQIYELPGDMSRALAAMAAGLAKAHYGKPLSWPEANKLMPKGTVLPITDLETGLTFLGQRRAGSAHMDVQPLTKADTAIMKTIYGGQWSWRRRAVLVGSPQGLAGASMHGMPHGGDGIPDNDFSGHFCIHFAGSVTHGSSHSDPAHQAMVHKASGLLKEYHEKLGPLETVDLFVVAVNQKDRHLLELLLHPAGDSRLAEEWLDSAILTARRLEDSRVAAPLSNQDLEAEVRARIAISRKGAPIQGILFRCKLVRTSAASAWFIRDIQPEAVIR